MTIEELEKLGMAKLREMRANQDDPDMDTMIGRAMHNIRRDPEYIQQSLIKIMNAAGLAHNENVSESDVSDAVSMLAGAISMCVGILSDSDAARLSGTPMRVLCGAMHRITDRNQFMYIDDDEYIPLTGAWELKKEDEDDGRKVH